MEIYPDVLSLPDTPLEPVVTLGNFDGVHRGHQAILAKLAVEAERRGAPSMVITFHPHPRAVLAPDARIPQIMSLKERLRVLWDKGIDHCLVIPFDQEFAEITAREFIEEVLWERLKIRAIYTGDNTAFGHGRSGDVRFLASEGRRLGFDTGIVDPVYLDKTRISSTAVRASISSGDMGLSARLLGRHHMVAGTVVHGDGRGKTIGVPTANIFTDGGMHPLPGVYAAWATTEAGQRHLSVVNVGVRPTFGASEAITVEAHLLDHTEDLYGQSLRLSMARRIRSEIAFDGVEQLKAQIAQDIEEGRSILAPKA
jgi:riboflavin kinase/FMN adenylyltransferase